MERWGKSSELSLLAAPGGRFSEGGVTAELPVSRKDPNRQDTSAGHDEDSRIFE